MSLPAIREKCGKVYSLALDDELQYWKLHPENLDSIASDVISLVQRDYGNFEKIPPHGRWRHFLGGRLEKLIEEWELSHVSKLDIARRLFDLMVVSVLLDAGAGDRWKFITPDTHEAVARSEGLALASFFMFRNGDFSSDPQNPYQCDSSGLVKVTAAKLEEGLQVSTSNPLQGADSRASLLTKLGTVISQYEKEDYFGRNREKQRPGYMIDYLQHLSGTSKPIGFGIDTHDLWRAVIYGFQKIWPTEGRVVYGKTILGDVWECPALGSTNSVNLVPFHKLSQWLTYSLIEVLQKSLDCVVSNMDAMTGLPEYRNGGLFIDRGVFTPKLSQLAASFGLDPNNVNSLSDIPAMGASHPAIVEWRALTVISIDKVAEILRHKAMKNNLTLPQILEAGTWKLGREVAAKLRPESRGPPLKLILDGTVF